MTSAKTSVRPSKRDQIDLAVARALVASESSKAESVEMSRGKLLAPAAER
ncbi:MAG TPA: hypothetical protein VMB51_06015 [Solirubrobacteraceae bacterium]|nr:hypothetical protein [Solirubrobacteraceae bacterium]